MSICIFEDFSKSTLLPLTHINPDFDLRCGIFTNRERLSRYFPDAELHLFVRMNLAAAVAERTRLPVNVVHDDTELFLNGSALLTPELLDHILAHWGEDRFFFQGDVLVACTAASDGPRSIMQTYLKTALLQAELTPGRGHSTGGMHGAIETEEVSCAMLRYPWDAIRENLEMLRLDAGHFALGTSEPDARLAKSVTIEEPAGVYIGHGVRIGAGVVIDASDGPVVIDENARIMPQAVILGPVFIGASSLVKAAAKIYEGTSVGPVCKIGGEVEECIFHSYANKQHDGFTGHSYFAAWTNLGADTNTSDLKNNYSSVRMTLEGKERDTGSTSLGTIMADHSKCGINTMFNTGTSIGVGCNIFGSDFPPKFLPSFSWGGASGIIEHEFDRFCATAEIVMQRRGQVLSAAERSLLRDVFVATSAQR